MNGRMSMQKTDVEVYECPAQKNYQKTVSFDPRFESVQIWYSKQLQCVNITHKWKGFHIVPLTMEENRGILLKSTAYA